MPGFNGTGPAGAGPMTGGGRGFCNPADLMMERPLNRAGAFGRGMAYGRGFSRGFGFRGRMRRPLDRGLYPPQGFDAYDDLAGLKQQADEIKRALDDIHKRIDGLDKTA